MTRGEFPRRPVTDGYVSGLVRKIISLGKAARLSAATQLIDLLAEAVKAEREGRAPGAGLSASSTAEEVQEHVTRLFPAFRSEELDGMRNWAGDGDFDPAEEAPGLQLSRDQLLMGIRQLGHRDGPTMQLSLWVLFADQRQRLTDWGTPWQDASTPSGMVQCRRR